MLIADMSFTKRIIRRKYYVITDEKYCIKFVSVPCPRCGGYGKLDDGTFCFYCNGKGYREIEVDDD